MAENHPCCTKEYYEVTHADLPLCCPLPDMRLWDGHPRVYLPIDVSGEEICPYCSAKYILIDFVPPVSDLEV